MLKLGHPATKEGWSWVIGEAGMWTWNTSLLAILGQAVAWHDDGRRDAMTWR